MLASLKEKEVVMLAALKQKENIMSTELTISFKIFRLYGGYFSVGLNRAHSP